MPLEYANVVYLPDADAAFVAHLLRRANRINGPFLADVRALAAAQVQHRAVSLSSPALSHSAIHPASWAYALQQQGWATDTGLAAAMAARESVPAWLKQTGTALRLTPVLWRASRDYVTLAPFTEADLSEADLRALAELIAPWLAHLGFTLYPDAQGYAVYCTRHFALRCPSLALAQRFTLDECLPTGEDARAWQAAHTELQMVLHQHPFNQRRVAQGLEPVNAFWLDNASPLPFELHDFEAVWAAIASMAVATEVFEDTATSSDSISPLFKVLQDVGRDLAIRGVAQLKVLTDLPTATCHEFNFRRAPWYQRGLRVLRRSPSDSAVLDWLAPALIHASSDTLVQPVQTHFDPID